MEDLHLTVRAFHAGKKKIARQCRVVEALELVRLDRNAVYVW